MATVYYLRYGNAPDRANEGRDFDISVIREAFRHRKVKWCSSLPVLELEPLAGHSDVSPYVHVVVHVRVGETGGQFPKEGYWLLEDVTPDMFERAVNEQQSDVVK